MASKLRFVLLSDHMFNIFANEQMIKINASIKVTA